MKEILFDLQLFGDAAEETNGAAAMGDGGSAENELQSIQLSNEDKMPDDSNYAGDDETRYDADDESEAVDISSKEDDAEILQSVAVFEEKSRNEDTFLLCERIISEADRLSEKVDGFDLRKELTSKSFTAMVKSGLSVEMAYNAVHFDELLAAAVQNAREETWREVLAKVKLGEKRPTENGAASGAAIQSRAGVENLTGRGIREILRRVENGAKIKF